MSKPAICSLILNTFFLLLLLQGCSQKRISRTGYYSMDDFGSIKKYDTHVHIREETDTLFIQQAQQDNFVLLNINVNSSTGKPVHEQQAFALKQIKAYPNQIAYATTISLKNWNSENWEKETLDYLKDSFSKGAVAVKLWKNIGLELKDTNGEFVMIDHPRFDPILSYLTKNNIPLIGHIGEPKNTWLPLTEMTVHGDRDYFTEHPQQHMYLHPEFPSYMDLINARDRMLEKHPDLKFIGAHLGSLEWSVDELAIRLDKYPNMAVDMAERISHLQYQSITERQKVHDFFLKYQDRLLYATDLRLTAADLVLKGVTDPADIQQHAHEVWLRHWQFFTTDQSMRVPKVEGEFRGLKLPTEVIDKIYRENAERWIPGLAKNNK
ncbi:amidohydrolase [Flammeovirgaceae bacterium 311]|nr:amidohydrolase [Flammeovirgaceae bacterium 311]